MAQVITIGSQCRVGSESVRVQLELYDKCAYSSIFYGIHAWGRIKREEDKELEKLQSDMLKRILNLPLSTPYTGVLMETGIWPVMARINYAILMLFHSVINSKNRLATDIVLQQEKSNLLNTFYQRVSEIGRLLDIDTKSDAIEGKRKSEWKKLCKERIQKSVRVNLQEQYNATKLRLVRNTKWGMKVYIRKGTGSLIHQVIKIKLNMTDQKRNFRNKYGENLNCPLCDVKEDTTEHVLSCSKMPPHQLIQDDLYNVKDIGLWRKIIELYSCNDRLCNDGGAQNSTCTNAVTSKKQAHVHNPGIRDN